MLASQLWSHEQTHLYTNKKLIQIKWIVTLCFCTNLYIIHGWWTFQENDQLWPPIFFTLLYYLFIHLFFHSFIIISSEHFFFSIEQKGLFHGQNIRVEYLEKNKWCKFSYMLLNFFYTPINKYLLSNRKITWQRKKCVDFFFIQKKRQVTLDYFRVNVYTYNWSITRAYLRKM